MTNRFERNIRGLEKMPQSEIVSRITEIDLIRWPSRSLRKQRRNLLSVLSGENRRQVDERRNKDKRTRSFERQIWRYTSSFQPDAPSSHARNKDYPEAKMFKRLEGYNWNQCVEVHEIGEGKFALVTNFARRAIDEEAKSKFTCCRPKVKIQFCQKMGPIRSSYELCVADYLRSRNVPEEVIQGAMRKAKSF